MTTKRISLLASKTGTISALKTYRETAKSYYFTLWGEGGKEMRMSKSEKGRKMFDNVDDAAAWIED